MALTVPTSKLATQTVSSSFDQLLYLDSSAGLVEATLKVVGTETGKSAVQLDDERLLVQGVDTSNAAAFEVKNTGGTSIFKVNASTVGATLIGALTIGADGAGHDVIFYSGTSGDNLTWDASEEVLQITGTNNQTSLDVLDGDLRVVDRMYLYDRGGEHISSNGTDLTINSGRRINLTPATNGDVYIPVDVGLRFGDGNQLIETDDTDLTITSDVSINLSTPQVDLLVDTNFVTTGGVNGMSIDGTTFSVDGANNRVGIGTASPAYPLETTSSSALRTVNITNTTASGTTYGIMTESTGGATTNIGLLTKASGATNNYGLIVSAGRVGIGTASPNSVLHIAAEDTTNVKGLRVQDSTDSGTDSNNVLAEFAYSNDVDLDGAFFCRFMEGDGGGGVSAIGGITGNADATTFATSSDYRLKEDFKDMVDATGTINELKLYDFKWKKSGKRRDGVIAHEADAIYPNAVIGEKDAMTTSDVYYREGDDIPEDKNIGDVYGEKEVIAPQMVDYSKFVPLLLKAIQELSAEVDKLKDGGDA